MNTRAQRCLLKALLFFVPEVFRAQMRESVVNKLMAREAVQKLPPRQRELLRRDCLGYVERDMIPKRGK